jgi:hypothetical protein
MALCSIVVSLFVPPPHFPFVVSPSSYGSGHGWAYGGGINIAARTNTIFLRDIYIFAMISLIAGTIHRSRFEQALCFLLMLMALLLMPCISACGVRDLNFIDFLVMDDRDMLKLRIDNMCHHDESGMGDEVANKCEKAITMCRSALISVGADSPRYLDLLDTVSPGCHPPPPLNGIPPPLGARPFKKGTIQEDQRRMTRTNREVPNDYLRPCAEPPRGCREATLDASCRALPSTFLIRDTYLDNFLVCVRPWGHIDGVPMANMRKTSKVFVLPGQRYFRRSLGFLFS